MRSKTLCKQHATLLKILSHMMRSEVEAKMRKNKKILEVGKLFNTKYYGSLNHLYKCKFVF